MVGILFAFFEKEVPFLFVCSDERKIVRICVVVVGWLKGVSTVVMFFLYIICTFVL